jgi:hypothetical protein
MMVKTMHTAKMSLHCEIRSTSSVALITQVMAEALRSATRQRWIWRLLSWGEMCTINRSGPESSQLIGSSSEKDGGWRERRENGDLQKWMDWGNSTRTTCALYRGGARELVARPAFGGFSVSFFEQIGATNGFSRVLRRDALPTSEGDDCCGRRKMQTNKWKIQFREVQPC